STSAESPRGEASAGAGVAARARGESASRRKAIELGFIFTSTATRKIHYRRRLGPEGPRPRPIISTGLENPSPPGARGRVPSTGSVRSPARGDESNQQR